MENGQAEPVSWRGQGDLAPAPATELGRRDRWSRSRSDSSTGPVSAWLTAGGCSMLSIRVASFCAASLSRNDCRRLRRSSGLKAIGSSWNRCTPDEPRRPSPTALDIAACASGVVSSRRIASLNAELIDRRGRRIWPNDGRPAALTYDDMLSARLLGGEAMFSGKVMSTDASALSRLAIEGREVGSSRSGSTVENRRER